MSGLIVVERNVPGLASAAILARYLRYYLLEQVELTRVDLRFTVAEHVVRLLRGLTGPEGGAPSLTKIMLAGLGPPADISAAEEALAHLKYQGVEVDWYDHRPWNAGGEAPGRLRRHCRLVTSSRRGPSLPQFLHDELSRDDHRSRRIVELARPSGSRGASGAERDLTARRWHMLLSAVTRGPCLSWTRGVTRRLAFGDSRFSGEEISLIEEEETRRRWMRRDFSLRLPFPVRETGTRQLMAAADIRDESGAFRLDSYEIARRIAAHQKVRYTLLAVSHRRNWVGKLFSWPAAVGDLSRIPGLRRGGEW